MKILMLNYEFPPIGGGAGNANLYLLREYSGKSDLEVDVLTSAERVGFFEEQFAENITIYRVGLHKKSLHFWRRSEVIEWLFKARKHYRRLVRENSYDMAHAFFGFPTGYLVRNGSVPYIISLRGSDVPGANVRLQLDYKILAPVFRKIWQNASALVACSEGLKDRAIAFMPSVSIDVIVNGVDSERFSPAENKRKDDTLKLLTVGRLSGTKRVEMLFEAVEILDKEGLDVRLRVVGGGGLEDQLKEMVAQKGLGSIIEMAGRVESEQMPETYRDSDIYVSATMQEGMSNAMLEAMASGLPIVTTPCEGLEELIGDNGIAVEQTGARAIADAVKGLAEDKARYEQMSLSARKAAERFDWKSVAQQYLDCYNNVINQNSGTDA